MPNPFHPRHVLRLLLCLSAIALTACAESPTHHPANGGLIHQQNEGFGLLYQLMTDESGVGQIFIIKHADDSVGNLVREVGQTCQTAKATLESFQKSDPLIVFNEPDLPHIEQRSRDLTAHREATVLLTSGQQTFEVRLIFTQAQAMSYAYELCKSLDEKETDPTRKEFLKNLAKQCDNLYDRLMALLTVK